MKLFNNPKAYKLMTLTKWHWLNMLIHNTERKVSNTAINTSIKSDIRKSRRKWRKDFKQKQKLDNEKWQLERERRRINTQLRNNKSAREEY